MALPGYYKVNFTDPRKEGFIIEPYQTNGAIGPVSSVLHNSAAHADTSLLLYGRDVPNYGERVAENFVQLLENFAGPAEPQRPIEGQLWFDTGTIYTVSAWSSANTLVFLGDHVATFNAFAASNTVLRLSFNPTNAAVDNSMQQVDLKATSAAASGAGFTQVKFVAADGQPIALPGTVIGGFVATNAPNYSRMRVATKVNGALKWVDITNVISSTAAPESTTRTIGDLWYDSGTGDLRVYAQSGWVSVAAKYLPLSGGTLTGTLQMGSNKIFSGGTITAASGDLYALVNRAYVDSVQSGLQRQIDELSDQVDDLDSGSTDGLNKKVNRSGDQMTGTLLFGDGTATTSLTRGIDLNNTPIIRAQITWNAADYILASSQANYVVDKSYVAKAFAQHLLDEVHGVGGFIEIQKDGSGVFPNNVAFSAGAANKTYSLSWFDSTGNNKHSIYAQFSGASSQLVLQAGTDSSDTIDFRHSTDLVGDPLFRVGQGAIKSYESLYIFDGQPQPTYNGTATSVNDDTKGATKGFVRKYFEDNLPAPVTPGTTLTAASYSYDVANQRYTLVLKQTGVPDISVNEYHKHDPYDIPYTYVTLPQSYDWVDGDVISTVGKTIKSSMPNITVGDMLELLNTLKAPVTDAIFTNTPSVGVDLQIVSYTASSKQIRVYGQSSTLVSQIKVGAFVNVAGSASNDGNYKVASVAAGASLNGKNTTIITVSDSIPATATESGNAFLTQGTYIDPTNPRGLVTRTTLDVELASKSEASYFYTKRASAGSNVAITLNFTYTPGNNRLWVFRNGQKLRVNTISGGDYNETSATTITIANVYASDEFEIYEV